MSKFKPVSIGLVSGAIAVLAIVLARTSAPWPSQFPDAIRLDNMDAYARKPSKPAAAVLSEDSALQREVKSFNAISMPFADALARLAEVAEVNIVTDWNSLRNNSYPISTTQPVTVTHSRATVDQTLRATFEDVAQQVDSGSDPVRWSVLEGIIYIQRADYHEGPPLVLRVYDVRDIMLDAAQFTGKLPPATRKTDNDGYVAIGSERDITERIIAILSEGLDGDVERSSYFAGRIIFSATPVGHAEIEKRLELLRKA